MTAAVVGAGEVETSAEAYALYCVENGSFLLSGNAGERLPMASTTKIMTSLITLEYAAEDNKTVEFTEEMTAEGSSMYLKAGEKVTLYDLAVGMMMQSGNDAANAAAVAISGSAEEFAKLMNSKADEIGMTDTHFVTPSGLDDEEHYSTAHDMALLMAYALDNEDFAEITAQTSMTVDFTEPDDKSVNYPNHNRLLRMYDKCIGGKTGYTGLSGRCLVSAARDGGMTLVAVTLNDRDDWDDHIALYDYGFDNYTAVQPETADREIAVVGGDLDRVSLYPYTAKALIVPRSQADSVTARTFLPPFAYAPVEKDDQAGKVVYSLDGETLSETPLYYAQSSEFDGRRRGILEWLKDFLKIK